MEPFPKSYRLHPQENGAAMLRSFAGNQGQTKTDVVCAECHLPVRMSMYCGSCGMSYCLNCRAVRPEQDFYVDFSGRRRSFTTYYDNLCVGCARPDG
jgi:hypothetical protein